MKARFNFWDIERPRNVTRREFNQHQLLVMGSLVTSFLSVSTAIMALMGRGDRLRDLATIPVMTIAEAAQYGREQAAGSKTDAVKLEGFLQAAEPLMGIAAYFLNRAQAAKWREFVIRSNQ